MTTRVRRRSSIHTLRGYLLIPSRYVYPSFFREQSRTDEFRVSWNRRVCKPLSSMPNKPPTLGWGWLDSGFGHGRWTTNGTLCRRISGTPLMFFLATTYALKHKMIMLCSAAASFHLGTLHPPFLVSELGWTFFGMAASKDRRAVVAEVNSSTPITAA